MKSSVSVVVPVFNGEASIKESINSLLTQSLREIEVILVNDASTDNTREVLNDLQSQDSRIHVIHLDKNVGVYQARATGLLSVNSPWVAFLDADDFLKPNMLKTMHNSAIQNDADIVLCEVDRVSVDKTFLSPKTRFAFKGLVTDNIFEKFCRFEFGTGALWNKLYKADLIKQYATYDHETRLDFNEDVIINLGAFHSAQKVWVIKESLYLYAHNPDSATSQVKHQHAYFSLLKAFKSAMKFANHHGFSKQDRQLISWLYRFQLEFPDYKLTTLALPPSEQEAYQALFVDLVHHYPDEFFLLTSRLPKEHEAVSCKKRFIRKLKKLFS